MRGVEDLGVLHADRGQLVDVEESAIVDLVGGRPPVGEAIGLCLEQLCRRSKLAASPGRPFHAWTTWSTCAAMAGERSTQRAQALAADLRLALPLAHRVGVGGRSRRQVLQRGQDAEELAQVVVVLAEALAQRVEVVAQQACVSRGSIGRRCEP